MEKDPNIFLQGINPAHAPVVETTATDGRVRVSKKPEITVQEHDGPNGGSIDLTLPASPKDLHAALQDFEPVVASHRETGGVTLPNAPDPKTLLDRYPPFEPMVPAATDTATRPRTSLDTTHTDVPAKRHGPKTTFERVAERTARADQYLQDKGVVTRAIAKGFNQLGNTFDLGVSALTHHSVAGPAGAAVGAVRGLFFGTVGALVCGGLLGLAPLAVPVLALSLVGFTAYHGVKSYNAALVKNQKGAEIGDWIGRKSGALPVPGGPDNLKRMPTLSQEFLPQPDPNIRTWRDRVGETGMEASRGRGR